MLIAFHLFLTLAIELLIYLFMDKFRLKTFITMGVANLVLNLTMNVIAMNIKTYNAYLTFIIIAEVSVFVIESCIYYLFTKKPIWYCLLASLAANSTSLAIGYIFNQTTLIYKNDVVITLTVIFALIFGIESVISLVLFLLPRVNAHKDNRDC